MGKFRVFFKHTNSSEIFIVAKLFLKKHFFLIAKRACSVLGQDQLSLPFKNGSCMTAFSVAL